MWGDGNVKPVRARVGVRERDAKKVYLCETG
jgi:hypothetical protein